MSSYLMNVILVAQKKIKAIGERRINAQAKLSLKTFDIVSKNSMALGMGITLRFSLYNYIQWLWL